jgi:thioredoxin-related protein
MALLSIFSFIIVFAVSSTAGARESASQEGEIKLSTNLKKDGALAQELGVPMILMFSAEECPYCMVMESDYLEPLLKNRDYDSKVLIRKLHLDGFDDLVNFSGETVSASDISQEYEVWVTPTLLFLDDKGQEIQRRMVGLGVRDFVSAYIDESINLASNSLGKVKKILSKNIKINSSSNKAE